MLNSCYYDLGHDVIKSLISAGADPNKANNAGGTPLSVALICKNDLSVIKELIKAGADVNANTNCGTTPLIFAVRNMNPPNVILTLIQAGADVNASINSESSNHYGFTSLHFAAFEAQEEVTRILVRSGADVHVQSKRTKKSPLDVASSEMREIILKERDIREKKEQALMAMAKVAQGNASLLEIIKQKSSISLNQHQLPRMKSSNELLMNSRKTTQSFISPIVTRKKTTIDEVNKSISLHESACEDESESKALDS